VSHPVDHDNQLVTSRRQFWELKPALAVRFRDQFTMAADEMNLRALDGNPGIIFELALPRSNGKFLASEPRGQKKN
jgi:hypothetical protein